MAREFQPKILAFLCNWCAYAGADLAGVSRFQYPTNIRIVRIMCSARMDATMVFKSFYYGADGVYVAGCHPGDCHYMAGNYYAEKKMKVTKKVMERIGIDLRRLSLDWVSATEGNRFAQLVTDFVKQIRELGPLGEGRSYEELERDILAAQNVVEGKRLRWLVGMERDLEEMGNVYGEKISEEEFDILIGEIVSEELAWSKISLSIEGQPLSPKEIAMRVRLPSEEVMAHLVNMRINGLVSMVDITEGFPRYVKSRE